VRLCEAPSGMNKHEHNFLVHLHCVSRPSVAQLSLVALVRLDILRMAIAIHGAIALLDKFNDIR
jgi:hypothetical protein